MLRSHACATHNYEAGMPLWDVQKLLGHDWASTTVGYLAIAKADPERSTLESSRRAVRRLGMFGIGKTTAIRYVRTAHPDRFAIDPTTA